MLNRYKKPELANSGKAEFTMAQPEKAGIRFLKRISSVPSVLAVVKGFQKSEIIKIVGFYVAEVPLNVPLAL